MLHFVHVALFCVVIFSCCTIFRVALYFLCIALFHVAFLHVAFLFCILLLLHSSHVAIFSFCTISRGLARNPQRSKMESFAFNEAVKCCCKALHLRCSRVSWLHLYYFHVALFPSCCTFLILKNIENERKTENKTKKPALHSASFCHCIVLNG